MKLINPLIKPITRIRQAVSPLISCRAAQYALRVLSYFAIWRVLCPDVRLIEWLSTGTALWWTLLLLGTPRMFGTNPAFAGLAERGKEREWGIVTALLSLLGLWVIVGASATVRFVAASLSFVVWMFVALNLSQAAPWMHPSLFGVQLAFAVPVSTGAGVYSGLATCSVVAAIKLGPHVVSDLHTTLAKCANKTNKRQAV